MPAWMIIAVAAVTLIAGACFYFLSSESARSGGKAQKRTAGLRQAAEAMGLRFEELSRLQEETYVKFPLFTAGNPFTTLRNFMTGAVAGEPATVFDFKYFTTHGVRLADKNIPAAEADSYHEQTVAVYLVRARSFPFFELRPEGLVDKVKEAAIAKYRDIDFSSHPGFSSKYYLRGQDEAAVRGLFNKSVLDFFEEHPGWCVQGGGSWALFFKHGTLVAPDGLETFLRESAEAFKAF